MTYKTVPIVCECLTSPVDSPWHCACGRWKPAAAQVCEVCYERMARQVKVPTDKFPIPVDVPATTFAGPQ